MCRKIQGFVLDDSLRDGNGCRWKIFSPRAGRPVTSPQHAARPLVQSRAMTPRTGLVAGAIGLVTSCELSSVFGGRGLGSAGGIEEENRVPGLVSGRLASHASLVLLGDGE